MKLRTLCLLAALAAATSACTTLNVRTDVDASLIKSVNCRNVAWAGEFHGSSPLRNGVANPLNESRLRAAIQANLPAVGLTLVGGPGPGVSAAASAGAGTADCLIGYGIGQHRVIDTIYPDGWAYGWGWGWGWGPYYGWGWGEPYPYTYRQGFISVDLYDAKSRQPFWHATVDANVAGLNGADAEKKIRAGVDAIFAKFPH